LFSIAAKVAKKNVGVKKTPIKIKPLALSNLKMSTNCPEKFKSLEELENYLKSTNNCQLKE
jgi:hypothetical protein